MSTQARTAQDTEIRELDATAKAVVVWLNHLGRTLKTCRLYDLKNPTVVKFREELHHALVKLLDEHGAITLRFTDKDLLLDEHVVHSARSRDDNLALVFHRDGVRGLTLSPGIERPEVEKLLDAILQVSGQNFGQDDLVTLLWEAHLPHIEVDYVPSSGDIGSGEAGKGVDEPGGVPWPFSGMDEEAEAEAEAASAATTTADAPAAETSAPAGKENPRTRSDDWTTGELTAEIEAGYATIDAFSARERSRFMDEFKAEHEVSPTTTALAIVRAALDTEIRPDDRVEFMEFTPRLLRLTVGRGAWLEAMEALSLLQNDSGHAILVGLYQELLQPISISTMVEHLDHQDVQQVADFVEFAKTLGDAGIDLLNSALAESQQRRNRRILAESITDLCRETPERLAPWLADRRWFVVRNIVHILGWIGGDEIVGLLRGVLDHPEPRVRYEVVAALGQVSPELARPVLLQLLDGADTRMFTAVLHQLAVARDSATARKVMEMMLDPRFEQRPSEERRAIYSALSALAGDEVVPELEAELLKGNWFARGQEIHRLAVARVLARIGTPTAQTALQRGLLSKRPPVRKACQDALAGSGS